LAALYRERRNKEKIVANFEKIEDKNGEDNSLFNLFKEEYEIIKNELDKS